MKKRFIAILLSLCTLLPACELFESTDSVPLTAHVDVNDDGACDDCRQSVTTTVDFFAVNDMHGKFDDTDSNEGVDELTTYLKSMRKVNPNTVLLSSGDMWQGSAESNLTKGMLITDWMNEMDFVSMTLGNHEYDWGESYIEANADMAEFPMLGINVYDKRTGARVSYCEASTTVTFGELTVGIIGAMGDVASSIEADKIEYVEFKVGDTLVNLVREEAARLRANGADFVVLSRHYGLPSGATSFSSQNEAFSGIVDLIFEGHTHQGYAMQDSLGIYHLQNKGEGGGFSHAQVKINYVTGSYTVGKAEHVLADDYDHLADDPIVDSLLEKYAEQIAVGKEVLGYNANERSGSVVCDLVAKLYYEKGIERWGKDYDIVVGGAYLKTRSPYDLAAGDVQYSALLQILPFDNQIVLAKIPGSKLNNFFAWNDYHVYGNTFTQASIVSNKTYYVVTDTYTSSYAPNGMTEVARLDETTFARDLLADYIRGGGLEN